MPVSSVGRNIGIVVVTINKTAKRKDEEEDNDKLEGDNEVVDP